MATTDINPATDLNPDPGPPSIDIVDRLQEIECDREPFTPSHAKCICLLTNEAAKEIAKLRAELAEYGRLKQSE